MSKDREKKIHKEFSEIVKIQNIIEKETTLAKQAIALYNAGFRDITDLRDWLDEKWNFDYNDAWYLALEPVDKGKVQMARTILDRLREL